MRVLFLLILILSQVVFAKRETKTDLTEVKCYGSSITFDFSKTENCNGHGCGFESVIKLSTGYSEVTSHANVDFISHDQYIINFNIPFHTASVISPIEGVRLGKYYDAKLVIYNQQGVYETHTVRCRHSGEMPRY